MFSTNERSVRVVVFSSHIEQVKFGFSVARLKCQEEFERPGNEPSHACCPWSIEQPATAVRGTYTCRHQQELAVTCNMGSLK